MNVNRILLIGSLLLFLSGICYSLFYHVFLQTAQQQALLYNFDMALNMAVKGDFETASAFAVQYQAEAAAQDIHNRIPLHLMLSGALGAALLFAGKHIEASERMQRIFSLLVVLGGFLLAAGDILALYIPNMTAFLTILAGFGWMAFGLIGYIIYLLLFMWLNEPPKSNRGRRDAEW